MKGIVLAGGSGTRLHPVTKVINKHLLPVYDKPMIFYPLSTLKDSGVKDILVITTDDQSDFSAFYELLDYGEEFNLNIRYARQSRPNGIAEAFIIAHDRGFLSDDEPCVLILGDNVFHSDELCDMLYKSYSVALISHVASIFSYQVSDPERYGVVEFDEYDPVRIVEKPKEFVSNSAVVGVYVYPAGVVGMAKTLTPSDRGELEITDLNNMYFERESMDVKYLNDCTTWLDTGTHDSLIDASMYVKMYQDRTGRKIGDLYDS